MIDALETGDEDLARRGTFSAGPVKRRAGSMADDPFVCPLQRSAGEGEFGLLAHELVIENAARLTERAGDLGLQGIAFGLQYDDLRIRLLDQVTDAVESLASVLGARAVLSAKSFKFWN